MWSGPETPRAAELVLGKYRQLVKLGQGGMGDVYLAASTELGEVGKLVVIKRLRNIEDPQHVAMFLDEARIASQLSHPNIVQTYEIGREAGAHLMVMEYLNGPTLRWLRETASGQGGISWFIEIEILRNVLDGLHYAHELCALDGRPLHLVHRDLSPENVIVTQLGDCKILDFGIAKAVDSVVQTQAGYVKGKLQYMPPEQLRGKKVDRRADIFAAGVILWEGLSGRTLWGDLGNVAIGARLAQGDIPSLQELGPQVPPDLRRLCEKALHPEPEGRFQTALDMKTALEDFIERNRMVVGRSQIAGFVAPLFREERERIDRIIKDRLEQPLGRAPTPRPEAAGAIASPTFQGATPLRPTGTRAAWRWLPLVAAGLAGLGVLWYWRASLGPPPAVMPGPPAQGKGLDNEAASKYVAAAEQLAEAKGYEAARGLLARAEAADITEPELNIRIARLRNTLEMAALLKEASGHLEGQRYRAAIDSARRVLDRHPQNAEALAIVASARSGQQAAEAGTRGRGKGRDREGQRKAAAELRLAAREPTPPPGREEPAPVSAPPPAEAAAPREAPAAASAAGHRQPDAGAPLAKAAPPPAPPAAPASKAPPGAVTPAAARARNGPVFSAAPPALVPGPQLPRVYTAPDAEQLARMCARVEGSVITLAGLSADFVRGITLPFQRQVGAGAEIYPVAMYYFIVREAASKHDSARAAAELVAAQKNRSILRLKDLPAEDAAR
jgi:serine/threonine protein kinase